MASIWSQVEGNFEAAYDPATGNIDTMKYIDACDRLAIVYDALFTVGMMAAQLKNDITNSANSVRKAFIKAPEQCTTLQDMTAHELKTMGYAKMRADRACGVMGMLWSKRAVQFICMYLELLVTHPEMSGSQCARKTYDTVLAKYHGWMTSTAVGALMGMAPSREDIYTRLGLPKESAGPAIEKVLKELRQVLTSIQTLLDANNLDFPDKV